ncbi:MAG: biotin transporter BioY [Rhodospirillales bacterium]|nr:biotin transporter BioY [Rhodospirillales bacterium]
MRDQTATQPTLVSAVWSASESAGFLRQALLALAGTALLTISAKIQVPFWPVPMTMQTFAVLVIAMAYGPRLGVATVALYLAEGAAGLPVFAGTPATGIGLAYMAGPTGGYLIGFMAAAMAVGVLARRGWDRNILSGLAAFFIGDAIIFACGVGWLSAIVGLEKAFAAGMLPFLPGEAVKIALAAALLAASWKFIQRRT